MTPPALVDGRTLERVERASSRLGSRSAITGRRGRVEADALYATWERAFARHGERVVQGVAESLRLDDLGLFGFSARTAPDTHRALEAALRFYPLISGDRSWALDLRADTAVLLLLSPRRRRVGRRVSDEAAMGQFLACMQQASCAPVQVREITLTERSLAPSLFGAYCRRAPKVGSECAIVLERASLDAPTTHAHEGMHAHFTGLADAQLATLRTPTWTSRCTSAMRHAFALRDGSPPIDHAVRSLGCSQRTLQRRLRSEGSSLQQILDDVRQDLAEALLRKGVSVDETARAVGFAEARAFTRAFVRWTGRTPGAFRNQQA